MTISQVAQSLGISISTIQKYERSGRIPKAQRSPGGWRVYTDGDVERIASTVRPHHLGARLAAGRSFVHRGSA